MDELRCLQTTIRMTEDDILRSKNQFEQDAIMKRLQILRVKEQRMMYKASGR